MVDDAIAMGIHHAGININLTALLQMKPANSTVSFQHGGSEWFINESYATREFLNEFARLAKERGDFEWHAASF